MSVYYLDRRLSLAESTSRFSAGGRETHEERHYVVAIRRHGYPGWIFRFPHRVNDDLESMVSALNRPGGLLLTTEKPTAH